MAAVQQEAIALRERVESLRGRRRELEELAQQEETAREEMGQLRAQAEQHTRRIQEWEGVAARELQITQTFTRLAELRAQDAEMGGLREQYITLQTQQAPLSQRVDTMPTLEAGASQARSELAVAEEQAVGLQSRQVELQQMELSRQTMESDNVRLRTEMEELRSKVDMLKEGDAKCPLCGTELGTEGKGHIEGEYEAQGKVMAQRFRQNAATLGELTPRQEEMATAVKREMEDSEERRRVLHGRIAALAQQLEEARKAPLELATVERGLSARTVHQTHRILKAAFKYAVRTGRLVRNPAELVDPPAVRRKEMATLTLDEARKLTAHLSGGDSYEIAICMALSTGLRRGELVGLKWGDINFAHKYLSLQRSVVRVPGEGFVVSEPKSHASRRPVELGEPDLKVLSGHRARQAEARLKVGLTWGNEDWVFTRQFGEHLNPDVLSDRFPRILENLGLPRVRFHDLRHTHATLMMEADINRDVVKERLGHSSIAITSDTYTHVSSSLQRSGVEAFWRMMEA